MGESQWPIPPIGWRHGTPEVGKFLNASPRLEPRGTGGLYRRGHVGRVYLWVSGRVAVWSGLGCLDEWTEGENINTESINDN